MGISRDHWHKRRATGGKRHPIRQKRKFELARPAAMTKLGPQRYEKTFLMKNFVKSTHFSLISRFFHMMIVLINTIFRLISNDETRTAI